MGHKSRFLIGGVGAAVAALSFVIGLEVQFAMARTAFEPTAFEPAAINRVLKGDRQPLTPGSLGENPVRPQKLPDGCEASFSSTRNTYINEIAGRCVAAAPTEWTTAVKVG
jgi:hypothetical protein